MRKAIISENKAPNPAFIAATPVKVAPEAVVMPAVHVALTHPIAPPKLVKPKPTVCNKLPKGANGVFSNSTPNCIKPSPAVFILVLKFAAALAPSLIFSGLTSIEPMS